MSRRYSSFLAWVEEPNNAGIETLHVCLPDSERPIASFEKTTDGAVQFMAFMEKEMYGKQGTAA